MRFTSTQPQQEYAHLDAECAALLHFVVFHACPLQGCQGVVRAVCKHFKTSRENRLTKKCCLRDGAMCVRQAVCVCVKLWGVLKWWHPVLLSPDTPPGTVFPNTHLILPRACYPPHQSGRHTPCCCKYRSLVLVVVGKVFADGSLLYTQDTSNVCTSNCFCCSITQSELSQELTRSKVPIHDVLSELLVSLRCKLMQSSVLARWKEFPSRSNHDQHPR